MPNRDLGPQGRNETSVSILLASIREGDELAFEDLFARVYAHLHGLASQRRRDWDGDFTMNTTALVHEAYLKLANYSELAFEDRSHFFAVASQAMRQILIDYARQRQTKKRGGDVVKVSINEGVVQKPGQFSVDRLDELISLDSALTKLEAIHLRACRIFECRFFGGMSVEETALALGISTATVKRGWTTARLWLHRSLKEPDAPPPPSAGTENA